MFDAIKLTPEIPLGTKSSLSQISTPRIHVTTASIKEMKSTPLIIKTLKICVFSKPSMNIPATKKTTPTPRTSGQGSLSGEFRPEIC